MIEEYDFGHIKIDGKDYDSDVIVDGGVKEWWRKTSHNVEVEDIEKYVPEGTEVIIGNGFSSCMEVEKKTIEFLEAKGCTVKIMPTRKAVAAFNESKNKKIGLFHLTC